MTIDEMQDFLEDEPIYAMALKHLSIKDQLKVAALLKEREDRLRDTERRRIQTQVFALKSRRRKRELRERIRERHERRKQWLRKNT